MTIKSPKNKGDSFERELAAFFNKHLFDGREVVFRALMSGGGRTTFTGRGGADLVGLPGFWVEAKRTETFAPRAAMAQAITGADPAGEIPVVINRRNRQLLEDSLVCLRLKDFVHILNTVRSVDAALKTPNTKPALPAAPVVVRSTRSIALSSAPTSTLSSTDPTENN